MSILTELKKINITPDQLSDLDKTGIIRIEKRLKAEVNFNENLTINKVEEVLYLLKNNKTELELLYTDYFKFFRQIIESPNTLITFDICTSKTLECSENFIEFISTYFKKELELYVVNCNKEKHYYALFSLLNYKDILSESFLDFILESLREKINFGVEILNLKPKNIFDSVFYLANPYFYRCITKLGTLDLEEDIVGLLNQVTENKNNNKLNMFSLRIFFALGEYKSLNSEIHKVILEARQYAEKNGIGEKKYSKGDTSKKGGTRINSNNSYESPSDSSESSNPVWSIIGIIILVIKVILIFGR